jgi:hypothetical protein
MFVWKNGRDGATTSRKASAVRGTDESSPHGAAAEGGQAPDRREHEHEHARGQRGDGKSTAVARNAVCPT